MHTKQLRLNAYSVNDAGHILCNREGRADERTAVLRIDAGHEIAERLVAIVDEPRALLGLAGGSAVLLFKCGERSPVPYVRGNDRRDGVFEMATRDGEKFAITCASDGQTLDVSAYTWAKGRSPLEIERDRLPTLTDQIGAAVMTEAFTFATWASIVETERADAARFAQLKADIASGKVKILTDAELEAAEDEKIAKSMGNDISYSDGPLACNVLAARKRIALRKQQAAEAA